MENNVEKQKEYSNLAHKARRFEKYVKNTVEEWVDSNGIRGFIIRGALKDGRNIGKRVSSKGIGHRSTEELCKEDLYQFFMWEFVHGNIKKEYFENGK